jgi:signal transduction histidine kinase
MRSARPPILRRALAPLSTVRARTTALAALVVGLALAASATLLLLTLRHSLERSGDDVARMRARDIATLAAASALPPILAVPGEDDIAQVVDGSGKVLAASPGHAGQPPIATFVPEGAHEGGNLAVQTVSEVPDGTEREDYRVWAIQAQTARGPVIVYVGSSLESVDETMAAVGTALAVGLPPLLALLALVTWFLLGRALHPVEAIRAEVAEISEQALNRRVPVPPASDEIGRLAKTMNATLDRLQAASERQRGFVADASHELQSPLAAFRAQLEVALAHPAATDWPAMAAGLLADSQRLERLVRDLLFLARSDATPAPSPTDPGSLGNLIDFDDIVFDEAARLRASTPLQVDTSRVSGAPLHGSRDQLTRLTRNLLENAERHAATTVRIELTSAEEAVRLVVADDGPGIPPEQRDRVFDRFTRLDGARDRDSGGTGLGLAIVKSIAERHRGTVSIEDSDGGARFVVQLPYLPSP